MRPQAALFALVLGAYAYFYQAGGWNQNSRLDLTRAIVERGTSRIDAFAKNTGDLSKKDGHYYCDKAPGQSWLAVPPYAVVHSALPLAWSAWFVTVVTVGLPSAIACVLLAGLLLGWGVRAGPAYATAAAWALATLAWPYGTLFYGHQTAASLLVSAFALAANGRPATPVRMAIVGLLLGGSVVVEYPAVIAAAAIAGYALWTHGWRRAAWIAAGAVPCAIALVAYHWILFGGPATTAYKFSTQHNREKGFFMGIGALDLDALWGITFSPYRGLFYSAPWLLLAIPGGVFLWRRDKRAEVIVCGGIALFFVWMNASLVDWSGGRALGPRYLVPCLPFLALLAAGLPWSRWLAAGAGVLVAYSLVGMLAGTAVKPEVHDKLYTRPFTQFLYPSFFRGDLAQSTQSIDKSGEVKNGPHQAWNLGDRVGLGGLASLVPLLVWCGAWGALLVRGVRRTVGT